MIIRAELLSVCEGEVLDDLINRYIISAERKAKALAGREHRDAVRREYSRRVGNGRGKTKAEMMIALQSLHSKQKLGAGEEQHHEAAADQGDRLCCM